MDYYLSSSEGQQSGPFSLDTIQAFLTTGRITLDKLYWTEGMADWEPLGNIEHLKVSLPSSTPPIRPIPSVASGLPDKLVKPGHFVPLSAEQQGETAMLKFLKFLLKGVQFVTWLFCALVLAIGGLLFFSAIKAANGAPQEAAAGAVYSTVFIGAYVFARVVEKICNLVLG